MSEGPIVCNSGPLIALSLVGCLDVLKKLYSQVLVPGAVIDEVVGSGAGRAGASEVSHAGWLEHVRVEPPPEPLLARAGVKTFPKDAVMIDSNENPLGPCSDARQAIAAITPKAFNRGPFEGG